MQLSGELRLSTTATAITSGRPVNCHYDEVLSCLCSKNPLKRRLCAIIPKTFITMSDSQKDFYRDGRTRSPLTYVPSQGLQCLVKIVVPKTIDCDTDSV